MTTVDMTFGRALKVWWAYAWRSMVLWIPVGIAIGSSMFAWIPWPRPGETSADYMAAHWPDILTRMSTLSLIMTLVAIAVQTLAMRWALHTQWSDFRLLAVSNESDKLPPAA